MSAGSGAEKKGSSGLPSDVSPTYAAVFAGVAAILWSQSIIRYFAEGMSLVFWNLIIPEKVVGVVAIWLDSIIAGLFVYAAAYFAFRGRKRVGSLRIWASILLVSAVLRFL